MAQEMTEYPQTDPQAIEADLSAPDPAINADTGDDSDDKAECLLSEDEIELRVEAALMTSDRPVPTAKLARVVDGAPGKAVREAIVRLNEVYETGGRSFRIEELAGGWRIMTLPSYAECLSALHKSQEQARITPAVLETLAVIAYKQPVLRADVEAIRGVACGETIRGLMDRRLVKIVGRAEVLGRPMLYGTTRAFLEVFGLASVKDLPKPEDLSLGLGNGSTPSPAEPPSATGE